MTISHHPDPATLMSFAAGTLSEALSAVVAAHADVCRACARDLRRLDVVGAVLLERLAPRPLSAAEPDPARPRGPEARRRPAADGRPLIESIVGGPIEARSWRRIAPGVRTSRIALSDGAKGDLRLLRVAAGKTIPEHGHGGGELTLVLAGAFRDATGHYRLGDIADLDADVEHTPLVDADGECICLIASETPARFKGVVSRWLAPIVGV